VKSEPFTGVKNRMKADDVDVSNNITSTATTDSNDIVDHQSDQVAATETSSYITEEVRDDATRSSSPPDMCSRDAHIDAIVALPNGSIFAFRGRSITYCIARTHSYFQTISTGR
jgi:hypothetical protein